jgi:hypothetical protein
MDAAATPTTPSQDAFLLIYCTHRFPPTLFGDYRLDPNLLNPSMLTLNALFISLRLTCRLSLIQGPYSGKSCLSLVRRLKLLGLSRTTRASDSRRRSHCKTLRTSPTDFSTLKGLGLEVRVPRHHVGATGPVGEAQRVGIYYRNLRSEICPLSAT